MVKRSRDFIKKNCITEIIVPSVNILLGISTIPEVTTKGEVCAIKDMHRQKTGAKDDILSNDFKDVEKWIYMR